MEQPRYLILENGRVFRGRALGATGQVIAEIVFTTAMTGYLETLTDPSYYGQMVVQAFPSIGNYGVIPADFEGEAPALKAYIVRTWCQEPSNFRSEEDLDTFLLSKGIVGLWDIDTRALVKIIREHGVMNALITDDPNPDEATLNRLFVITARDPATQRIINRLVAPSGGSILFKGEELSHIEGRKLREARRRIGMVFQEYNLVERLSVMENLLTGRLGYISPFDAWRRKFPAEDIAYAYRLLDIVGLSDFAHQRADSLSGGQRQRVGSARALMQRPEMLLADEPTSSLDPKTSVEIMEVLKSQGVDNRIPVLVNIHDVELAKRFADRIIGMTGGRVVFDGEPDALTSEHLKLIYGGSEWLQ